MKTPLLALSIVSHNQGGLVRQLLDDIRRSKLPPYEAFVTINVPEPDDFLTSFGDLPLRVLRNDRPKGFGSNHNAAFAISQAPHFVVLNPDVRLHNFEIAPLLELSNDPSVGACIPLVLSGSGGVEDNARRSLTIPRLMSRLLGWSVKPDYDVTDEPLDVDWAAGIFIMFRRDAFAAVKGFDERFFMYCEDADVCARLRRLGYSIVLVPKSVIVHNAQRASHRRLRYSYWHVKSLIRLLRAHHSRL